jgi:hypothetical protein
MEYVYYGLGALMVLGLLVLLRRTGRWIGESTGEGLEQTLHFAQKYGLDPLDAEGHGFRGVVGQLPVSLSEGAIVMRAYQGRIGSIRTLRIVVQAAAGPWLLCQRNIAEKLEQPLPELGQEHPLGEPGLASRFLLRAEEAPRFADDIVLLQALAQTEIRIARATEDRTTVDFLVPVEFVGGLGGSVETLDRLLMLGLALAAPERSREFLGEASAYR